METSDAIWKPEIEGKYSIMVQAKRKESNKPFDFMSKTDYIVGDVDEKLINDIYIDKTEIMVGEKITLTVEAAKSPIMYRYWVHEQGKLATYKGLFTRKYTNLDFKIFWRTRIFGGMQKFRF